MLRNPWLIEVADPSGEWLVGTTASLGSYQLDGRTCLVGLKAAPGDPLHFPTVKRC